MICGLSTFIIKGHANFQLEANKNKNAFFFHVKVTDTHCILPVFSSVDPRLRILKKNYRKAGKRHEQILHKKIKMVLKHMKR